MTKIAYLLNSYPMTSTTFIRREIEALERQGLSIARYAIRHWDGALVDPADMQEQERTHYLLTGNLLELVFGFAKEIFTNPAGLTRAIGPWISLIKNAKGGIVRHIAYLMQAALLRQRVRADAITHVHVHFATNAAAVAMLARIMGGVRYSFTVHGPDELTDAPLLSFPAKIAHAEFVVAISHFCKSQIVRFSSIDAAKKTEIVHCGLEISSFECHPPKASQTLICVGRLCPQKGQVQIPCVVAALRAEFPDLRVELIGDGPSKSEIEAEINRFDVGDNVQILGWMENKQVRARLAASRGLLLPTFAEGLPVVIMEALALGRPAISTYIAGIPELLDEGCGWIVPAGDEAALTLAIRALMNADDDKCATLGAEGRARIERDHDVDKEAAKLAARFTAP